MTAPSKNWTNILDTQIDADSPIDVTLMTEIRDNLVNLKEWLGRDYTAAVNHGHDGIDSKLIPAGNIVVTDTVSFYDDFIQNGIATADWAQTGTVGTTGEKNGWVSVLSTAAGTWMGVFGGVIWTLATGATITFEARVKRANTAQGVFAGLLRVQDAFGNDSITFSASTGGGQNNGNWWAKTTDLGGQSAWTDTGVPATANTEFVLKFVATNTSVFFYVDGVLKATHTTHIYQGTGTNMMAPALCTNNVTYSFKADYIKVSSSARV